MATDTKSPEEETKYTTMQVSFENRNELADMKPHGQPMKEWFNSQLAVWIEFQKRTDHLARR